MTPNRLNLVTLGVTDLAASKAFYEALGLVAEDAPPSVVFFPMGGFKLGLFGLDMLAQELGRPVSELGRGAVTLSVNWPSEADVDAAFEAAIAAGARAVSRPTKMEWGGYSSYWADPDGHVWEYAFNPVWPLDSDGWISDA